jgi:DnaK suppressor protein
MSTSAVSTRSRPRAASRPSPNASSSVPPPSRLTAAQRRELEAELRRELVALDRRLLSERQADSAETRFPSTRDLSVALLAASDTAVRRDLVASALARLADETYGMCARCGEPIPYGRLLVMPEATHCLRCHGRA